MPVKEETMTREEATGQVLSIVRRMALLHHSFAKTLVQELRGREGEAGDPEGDRLLRPAGGEKGSGENPGQRPGDRPGELPGRPPPSRVDIEMVTVDGEPRARIRDCHLAQAWKELGAPELGRLYCYMDQTKYEAYDPALECVHEKNILDGAPYCELAVRTKKGKPTTQGKGNK